MVSKIDCVTRLESCQIGPKLAMSFTGEGDSHDGCIRVGKEYQAVMPAYVSTDQRHIFERQAERALLVWSPALDVQGEKIDEYIELAKQKYGYNAEQALGMLFWHKHSLQKAVQDLPNFTPFPDDWSLEDRVLFEQAFQFHGKSFRRIRQMLPDKTIAQLVKYYYSWKKSRTRSSVMDKRVALLRQTKESRGSKSPSANHDDGHDDCEVIEEKMDSVDEAKELLNADKMDSDQSGVDSGEATRSRRSLSKSGNKLLTFEDLDMVTDAKSRCQICLIECNKLHSTAKGEMCATCSQHYESTGSVRTFSGVGGGQIHRKDMSHKLKVHQQNSRTANPNNHHSLDNADLTSREAPEDMYINHDDILTLASGPNECCDVKAFEELDQEIIACKRTVQNNKQNLAIETKRRRDAPQCYPDSMPSNIQTLIDENTTMTSKWSDFEITMLIEGVKRSGRDFKSISSVIKSKNEMQVRNYFSSNKSKNVDLDKALKLYESSPNASSATRSASSATDDVL